MALADMEVFFDGYTIDDTFRTANTRTDTFSVVYALFATVAERIRASDKDGSIIRSRAVKIMPAASGNNQCKDSPPTFKCANIDYEQ